MTLVLNDYVWGWIIKGLKMMEDDGEHLVEVAADPCFPRTGP